MGLETVNNIPDLNPLWPLGSDPKAQGDDHMRNIKLAVVTDLASLAGPLTATAAEINGWEARIAALEAAPPDLKVFAGMVAGGPATLPEPWLLCDGQSLDTGTWPDLFAILAYTYGGSGANFSVPDYRGEVLRGTSAGSGRDPDAAARSDRGDGTVGDVVGTRQGHEINRHRHLGHRLFSSTGSGPGFRDFFDNTGPSDIEGEYEGGNETRARNVNSDWHIFGGVKV